MGIETIAAVVSAVAAAAGTAYQGYQMAQGAPKAPGLPGPSKADLASSGAMRSSMFGSTTPGFNANLAGVPAGPLAGAGSAVDKPIGGADDYARLLAGMSGGGLGSGGGGLGG